MNIQTIEKGLAESLIQEFKNTDISLCLIKIGVLKQGDILESFHDLIPWHRGGAETYIAISTVVIGKLNIKVIAKALVSFASRPDQQLISWNRRRRIIAASGIRTPKLFSTFNGTIYEEFIDQEFSITSDLPIGILEQLAFIAAQLDKNGFESISFTNDLRIKEGIIYYVDFGFDLGDSSSNIKNSAYNHLLKSLRNNQFSIVNPIYKNIMIG